MKEVRRDLLREIKDWNLNPDDYDTMADLMDEYRVDAETAARMWKAQQDLGLNSDEAYHMVTEFPNESTWTDVFNAVEALDVGIEDVVEEDVEIIADSGGEAVGEIDSSIGTVIYKYDIATKLFILYVLFEGNISKYVNIPPTVLNELKSYGGEYFNKNIRVGKEIVGQEPSPYEGCGCGPNPCTPDDLSDAPKKYKEMVTGHPFYPTA